MGEFANGSYNGRGTLTYPNGDKYEGNFVNNKKSGKGKYTFADGSVQDGLWKDDQFVK